MDLNPLKFADFAKQAARDYAEKGISLNRGIAKLADENNLSPMQIQRVVELANSETNQRLFKTAGDKTFTFDLATLEGVKAELNPETETVKTASVLGTLFPSRKAENKSLAGQITKLAAGPSAAVNTPLLEKRGSLAAESLFAECHKRVVRLELDKLAAEMEKASTYSTIKDMALTFVAQEQGKLSSMYKFACVAHPDDKTLWQQLFTDIRQDLMKLGHPVDRALIDEKFGDFETPTEVINGRHAMLILLDTFKNKVGEIDKTHAGLAMYNDAPDPVPVEIRSIQNNADVRAHLSGDIESLAKKAADLSEEEFIKAATAVASKAFGGAASWAYRHPLTALLGAYIGYKGLRDVGRGAGRAIQQTRQPSYLEQPAHGGFRGL